MAQHGKGSDTRFFVVHAAAGRWSILDRENQIKRWAQMDRVDLRTRAGLAGAGARSAGKVDAEATIRNLAGFDVHAELVTGPKHVRWQAIAAQQQAGNVWIVEGDWDWQEFIRELDHLSGDEQVDKPKLKDLADAAAGAFNRLTDQTRRFTCPMLSVSNGDCAAAGPPPHRASSSLGNP